MSRLIKRMAHVALCVPDLDSSVSWATTVMGLREVERIDGTSYLSHGSPHHSLQYIQSDRSALHHVSMQAHNADALAEAATRLTAHGLVVHEEVQPEPGIEQAIRFSGPEGHLFEIFVTMQDAGKQFTGRGVQPRKFGHPTITCEDTQAARAMFEEALEFRLSDEIGDGVLFFLRCNVDHHGMGIQRGPAGLNHYAWQVESLGALGALGDTLALNGGRFIWGPGRHGAGRNLFTYHFDPAGCVVEYYADLYQVWDEASYVPGHWSLDDHRGQNLWGPTTPQELLEAFTPNA